MLLLGSLCCSIPVIDVDIALLRLRRVLVAPLFNMLYLGVEMVLNAFECFHDVIHSFHVFGQYVCFDLQYVSYYVNSNLCDLA